MVLLQDLNEGMGDGGSVSLVCPMCRGELALEKAYRRLGRVRTGELRCLAGCAVYPIIYGVPIMLPPGQPARWKMPLWALFLRKHGKQKLMEAIAAGEFDKEVKASGPPVSEQELKKVKRNMTKAGWQRCLKKDNTSSNDPDAVALAERLSQIESGTLVDFGCGGGFTTERVLQYIQPSVCCVPIDIDFECAKRAGKRAELLGMGNRCLEMCANLKRLPFADGTLAAVYTRNGFNHIHGYVAALKEAYRATKKDGHLVVTDGKFSMWQNPQYFPEGMDSKERLEILSQLGLYVDGQNFIEHIKRVGFDVLAIDDLPMPKRFKFLVEALKA